MRTPAESSQDLHGAILLWSSAPGGALRAFGAFDRLTVGHGVFDTLLVRDGAMVDGPAHFARLARHAAALGIAVDADLEAIAARALAAQPRPGRWRLRTTLTAGDGPPGLAPPPEGTPPTIVMTLAPAPDPAALPPVRAVFASIRRNETSPLSRIKSINCGDQILALAQARARGADEALFLNTQGRVACATAANLFARLADGTLATPPLADGAMDGITRADLLRRGAVERSLSPEDLFTARAAFLTNSLTGPRPVCAIEGRTIALTDPDRP